MSIYLFKMLLMYIFVDTIKITERMGKIKELSTVELAKLSSDEFGKLLNEEKAEAGIPIVLPEFPKRNDPPELESMGIAYKVGDIYVLNKDDAKKISDLLKTVNAVGVSLRFDKDRMTYLLKPDPVKLDTEICGVELFNIDEYEKRESDIRDGLYDTKESYEKKKDEYYDLMDRVQDFNRKYIKIYLNAVDKLNEMDNLKRIFNKEYVSIAKGDRDVAMSFLKKAYPGKIDEEVEEYILHHQDEDKIVVEIKE